MLWSPDTLARGTAFTTFLVGSPLVELRTHKGRGKDPSPCQDGTVAVARPRPLQVRCAVVPLYRCAVYVA